MSKNVERYMVAVVGFDTIVIGAFPNACIMESDSCDVGADVFIGVTFIRF